MTPEETNLADLILKAATRTTTTSEARRDLLEQYALLINAATTRAY